MPNFKEQCTAIIKDSIEHYDQEASQYQKTVFTKIRQQIEEQIYKDLLFCFDSQLKILESRNLETFKQSMKGALKKDVASDNFHDEMEGFKQKALSNFTSQI